MSPEETPPNREETPPIAEEAPPNPEATPPSPDVAPPSAEEAPPNPEATPPVIRLDDFIKRSGLVGTGGEAKIRIQSGEVLVNGEVETRRRKQLCVGDVIDVVGECLVVSQEY